MKENFFGLKLIVFSMGLVLIGGMMFVFVALFGQINKSKNICLNEVDFIKTFKETYYPNIEKTNFIKINNEFKNADKEGQITLYIYNNQEKRNQIVIFDYCKGKIITKINL